MEGEKQYCDNNDGVSLNIPLLENQNQHGHERSQISGSSPNNGTGTTPFLKTCFNGLNALSGVGILSVPYALASGGWLSLCLLFAIAATAFYTGLLMKRCMDNNTNIRTYPDIGEVAFGKIGRLIVSISMYTELYLVSIGFLILEGDNLSNLFPIQEFHVAGLVIGGRQFFVVLVALIILPTVLLDNLSLLSYVSASGVVASVIIILSISWTATFDGVGLHQKGTLIDFNGFPTAVSLYAFCYCAHPVFPTLYNSMKNKHQFSNIRKTMVQNIYTYYFSLYAFCYSAHPVFPSIYNSMTNKQQFSNVLLVCFTLATIGYICINGYTWLHDVWLSSSITSDLELAS